MILDNIQYHCTEYMFILNAKLIEEKLRKSPYQNITGLAKDLKIHRNTIHFYLSGNRVLPQKFEEIINALNITPAEALIKKTKIRPDLEKEIALLADSIHKSYPHISVFLFGSRAREIKDIAQKKNLYRDIDLGIFSSEGISFDDYLKIISRKSDFEENSAYVFDVTNLNNADNTFLKTIYNDLIFLNGRLVDWNTLREKIENVKNRQTS